MKRFIFWGMLLPLMAAFVAMPVYAQTAGPPRTVGPPETTAPPQTVGPYNLNPYELPSESYYQEEPPADMILADVLIVRPLSMVACVLGLAGSFVSLPFAATSNSGKVVADRLIKEPFEYTFTRPLGEVIPPR